MNFSHFKKQLLPFLIPSALVVALLVALNIAAPYLIDYLTGFLSEPMSKVMTLETFDNFLKLTKVVLWMTLVILVVRFVNSLIFDGAFRARREQQASTLLRNVFSILIYIVAFFVVFKSQYPGIDLAALFTTSAILGVILGLALQDTLGNLFSGISLQADQPFQVGDVINIPGKGTGVIENITWRGLKIRTFQNKLLLISNSVLGKETFEVAPRDNLNARIVFFSTTANDSPTKTIHTVREAVREAENVSTKIKPIVRIRDFSDHGVDWEVKYWLDDYTKYNDTDALVRKRIWYAFLREKIEFASPTQTVIVKRRQRKPKEEDEAYKVFERLSAIEILEPLSDEETMQIAKATARRMFAPGETIIRQGAAGNTMFIINSGRVTVQITDNDGSTAPRTLATLDEGRFFGEMALLTGEPRSATIVAAEETEVFEIGHAAVKQLFNNNPYVVEGLSRAVAERRMLLNKTADQPEEVEREHAGIFSAIKRFFSLN